MYDSEWNRFEWERIKGSCSIALAQFYKILKLSIYMLQLWNHFEVNINKKDGYSQQNVRQR